MYLPSLPVERTDDEVLRIGESDDATSESHEAPHAAGDHLHDPDESSSISCSSGGVVKLEIVNGDEDEGDDIIDEDQPDEDAAMIVVTHVSADGSHTGMAPKTQLVKKSALLLHPTTRDSREISCLLIRHWYHYISSGSRVESTIRPLLPS